VLSGKIPLLPTGTDYYADVGPCLVLLESIEDVVVHGCSTSFVLFNDFQYALHQLSDIFHQINPCHKPTIIKFMFFVDMFPALCFTT
jgi:hypothetical protein